MEAILTKASNGGGSGSPTPKIKKIKVKKSTLQLSKELIPAGKYAGLSDILEPYELGLGK